MNRRKWIQSPGGIIAAGALSLPGKIYGSIAGTGMPAASGLPLSKNYLTNINAITGDTIYEV